MRFLRFFVLSIFFYQNASAQFLETGFYSQGKFHAIKVDKKQLAIPYTKPANQLQKITPKNSFSKQQLDLFKQMGVSIAKRSAVKKNSKVIGYPMAFGTSNNSAAILTHEIVIRTNAASELAIVKKSIGFSSIKKAKFKSGLYIVSFTSPLAALKAANSLYKREKIIYSHPNFLIPKNWRGVKNKKAQPELEPLFSHQWHLENTGQTMGKPGADISAKRAWTVSQGDPEILIAIIDGGFDQEHEDLAEAWFRNPGETPNDGIDNDENGLIDDVAGWNFHANSPDLMDAPFAHHGTAVAGLTGARANNLGITGTCPNCTILPIATSFKTDQDAAGIRYAQLMGADIISNSWGYAIGTPATDIVVEAIQDAFENGRNGKKTIILFAMNNIDTNDCTENNPDISSLPTVIAVSAATDKDQKSDEAAWGACMEFISPTWMYQHKNGGIVTTDISGDGGYNPKRNRTDLSDVNYTRGFSGTSAATPIAAGIFGLLLSVDPRLTRNQALEIVLTTADKISPAEANYDPVTGFSLHYGYGRINAYKAVMEAQIRKRRTALIIKGSGI